MVSTVVTKVNLPDKARARLDEASNFQRVQKPHDIRMSIPMVDYTNPARFPPHVHREYPKMPLMDGNRPIVIDESGSVLVFYNPEDEAEFMEMNEALAEEIARNTPIKAFADRVAAQASEIEDLRARLRAAGVEDEKPRGNRLARAVRAAAPGADPQSPAADDDDTGAGPGVASDDAPGGLRATLPQSGNNPLKRRN